MPLTPDAVTGEVNSAAFALDTHEAVAGGGSIFESIGNVLTKGVALTGLSIVNSFANTGVAIGNWFGGDYQKQTMEDLVGDGSLLDYYKTHEQGIEAAGLVAGSLIPGMAAIKVLKLAQAGKMTGAMETATNIFAGPKERIVKAAVAEIEAGDAALYGALKADKFKAIALGYGDQALQALVYEAATAGTMHGSPLLDKNGLSETINDMFFGALVGGGVGGTIEGIFTNRIINKALLNADTNTKAQELATYLGKGGYFPGDRVAELLRSIDDMPVPTGLLGRKKALSTKDAAELNARKILVDMVPDGDESLVNAFMDTLQKFDRFPPDHPTLPGRLDKDAAYEKLARLSKISNVDEVPSVPSVPSGTILYINRFAKGSDVSWNQLVSNTPEAGAEFSLGYRLRQFATEPKIARFSDEIEWEGNKIPRYTTAKEAFAAGNDIFIDSKLRTLINDDAPNIERIARAGESRSLTRAEEKEYRKTGNLPEGSKPLLGAPIILNTRTGIIRESVVPVVGDYGLPKLSDELLLYGSKRSTHYIDKLPTAATPTLDANARYVWWSLRGLKNKDNILPNDIAGLEQIYRESAKAKTYEDFLSSTKARGITLDKVSLPVNQSELLNHIRAAKDDLIADVVSKNSKLSVEEAAQRANVPESYIENLMKANTPAEYMIDPLQHSAINHVKLEYDIGNIYQQDGQIARGMIDVQYRIQQIKDTLEAATASHFGALYDRFIAKATADEANIVGVGAKGFTSSNADYGALGQKMERIGREVTDWSVKQMARVSETLSGPVNAIRDDIKASAELGFFIAVRQRTNHSYTFLPTEIAVANNFPENTAVLTRALKRDRNGNITGWDKDYLPEGFLDGSKSAAGEKGAYNYYKLSAKVADFERANQSVNDARVIARNKWFAAQGINRTLEPGSLYTPPIDTTKYPHFALVKARLGTGLADDGVAVITAETSDDLAQKIASLKDDYSVYTKDLLKTHHEVLGDYEYGRNFAQSGVDTMLSRRGILNNIYPDTRAETIIKNYIDWHTKQELRLTRDYVEIGNGQLFAELRAMGERFTAPETSRTGFVAKFAGKTVENPYDSYIKTALGISPKDNYTLWANANEKLEAFFDTAFRTAKSSFIAAQKGLLPIEEASAMGAKFGLGDPWGAADNVLHAYTDIANKLPPERYLSKHIATANSVLSATAIRLDMFQSVINAVSTPILLLAEINSARSSQLTKLLTIELPDGSGRSIPGTMKIFHNAVNNWLSADTRATYMPLYKEIGAVRNKSSEYFAMIEHLTLPYGRFSESAALDKLKKAVDLGAKLTGSELSEEFGRFIAADSARQLFEAAGYTGRGLTDNISTLVNRVHGNYVASQRPVAFQGVMGQAIGLFQTYQFNLLQQVFRYIENGEGKTLAILAGMQSTLFGMQGLPGFQAINNHIVGNAANNPEHKDFYSTVPNLLDEKLGKYLLYGTLSNWMQTGLYSRGDINPRQITILPVNPLDYPAVSGGIRFIGSLLDSAKKIVDGGGIAPSLLLGLEHNGLSRPLTGLAQMVQGFSTTGKGSLVAATRPQFGDNSAGLNDLMNVATYSRLLGARPLDEAIIMDAMYRHTLYQAKDSARIGDVGEAVKTHLYGNQSLSSSEIQNFAAQYAASGGHIEKFGSKLMEWSQGANASVANQMYRSLQTPSTKQMMIQMGGRQLPDFINRQNQAAASGPSTAVTAPALVTSE